MTASQPDMQSILSGPRVGDEPLRFIPVEALGQGPDSTQARQVAIRRLIRLLDNERRACVQVEVLAEDLRQFRTMQCATRLSNTEARLRNVSVEVAMAWDQYQAAQSPHPTTRESGR